MKLTKNKIQKLLKTNNQSRKKVRKNKRKRATSNEYTFRKQRPYNLRLKTLKIIKPRKIKRQKGGVQQFRNLFRRQTKEDVTNNLNKITAGNAREYAENMNAATEAAAEAAAVAADVAAAEAAAEAAKAVQNTRSQTDWVVDDNMNSAEELVWACAVAKKGWVTAVNQAEQAFKKAEIWEHNWNNEAAKDDWMKESLIGLYKMAAAYELDADAKKINVDWATKKKETALIAAQQALENKKRTMNDVTKHASRNATHNLNAASDANKAAEKEWNIANKNASAAKELAHMNAIAMNYNTDTNNAINKAKVAAKAEAKAEAKAHNANEEAKAAREKKNHPLAVTAITNAHYAIKEANVAETEAREAAISAPAESPPTQAPAPASASAITPPTPPSRSAVTPPTPTSAAASRSAAAPSAAASASAITPPTPPSRSASRSAVTSAAASRSAVTPSERSRSDSPAESPPTPAATPAVTPAVTPPQIIQPRVLSEIPLPSPAAAAPSAAAPSAAAPPPTPITTPTPTPAPTLSSSTPQLIPSTPPPPPPPPPPTSTPPPTLIPTPRTTTNTTTRRPRRSSF